MNPGPLPNEEESAALAESLIPSAETVARVLHWQPTAQVDEVVWLTDFARGKSITTFASLAREIGVSEATVSRVLRGKYNAGLASFVATIVNFRKLWLEREGIGQEPWVAQLSVVKRVSTFCDMVRTTNQIGLLWGPNQSGKSTTLEHYAADPDHPLTAYAALPPGGAVVASMQEIARGRGGFSAKKRDLRDLLLRRFNSQWLLIVDEFHQTMKSRSFKAETIDRIREIHDRCKCPVLLCGTDIIPEMMEDPRFKTFLGQIGNRGVLKMRIPPAPEPNDIILLAQAYGIEREPNAKAAAIAKKISDENGISKLTDYFKMARQLASNAHERLDWKHFVTTHATLGGWERGEFGSGKKKGAAPANVIALTENG